MFHYVTSAGCFCFVLSYELFLCGYMFKMFCMEVPMGFKVLFHLYFLWFGSKVISCAKQLFANQNKMFKGAFCIMNDRHT